MVCFQHHSMVLGPLEELVVILISHCLEPPLLEVFIIFFGVSFLFCFHPSILLKFYLNVI